MAVYSIPALVKAASDAHLMLTRAHRDAAVLARLLHDLPATVSVPDSTEVQEKAIELGTALDSMAKAERACSCCWERHRDFRRYEEMLENHRQAYLEFERLASGLENGPPCSVDIAKVTADLGNHLNAAEAAHQASLLPSADAKPYSKTSLSGDQAKDA